jgi:hypothetical protein
LAAAFAAALTLNRKKKEFLTMTKKELIKEYRKWVDSSFTFDYKDPKTGESLPFYPFYKWVEFFTDVDPALPAAHRGVRAKLFRDYRVWCVDNGYNYENPCKLGIEYIV